VKKARQLAKIHNAPIDKVEMGAYLHDVAKFFETSHMLQIIGEKYEEVTDIAYQTSELLHGFAGAEYVKEKFKITDEEILDAIRYHTIGKKNMGLVSKIVYIADAIEDKRNWPGVEHARELAAEDLDEAIIYEIDMKMKYLITRRALIHPNTLELRNDLIHKDMNEKI
jgi:predicted HD superfamily hydrolase involved in NAD metabolism